MSNDVSDISDISESSVVEGLKEEGGGTEEGGGMKSMMSRWLAVARSQRDQQQVMCYAFVCNTLGTNAALPTKHQATIDPLVASIASGVNGFTLSDPTLQGGLTVFDVDWELPDTPTRVCELEGEASGWMECYDPSQVSYVYGV
jgi:hypothetical protein